MVYSTASAVKEELGNVAKIITLNTVNSNNPRVVAYSTIDIIAP